VRFDRKYLGALIGAAAGLLLTKKALGALAGAAVGHFIASRLRARRQLPPQRPRDESPPALRFVGLHAELAATLARIGGEFDTEARRATRSFFEVDLRCADSALARVDAAIESAARASQRSVESVARALASAHDPNRLERERVLFAMFRIALLRPLTGAREEALRAIARGLGLGDDDFAAQRAAFVPSLHGRVTEVDYRVLDAEPGMSLDEVKDRYREAARKWHPDRFQHLGAARAHEAAERFKAIQSAWERIQADAERAPPPRASRCPNCRKFTALDETDCIRCGHPKIQFESGARALRCAYCHFQTPYSRVRARGVVDCGNCRAVLVQ